MTTEPFNDAEIRQLQAQIPLAEKLGFETPRMVLRFLATIERLTAENRRLRTEIDEWCFVPDEHGGHMLSVPTGDKWYPESFLTARLTTTEKERDVAVELQERESERADEWRRAFELASENRNTLEVQYHDQTVELDEARERIGALVDALQKVVDWKLPELLCRRLGEHGCPIEPHTHSYSSTLGSNGEREFMRNIAFAALLADTKEPKQ